jgi:hypothetical protein
MAFFTRQDDLRFRRTTWLLSKLQVTGPRGDTTNYNPSSSSAEAVALEQLCSLVNLFVRKHEIIAVIPTATPRQQTLYVAAQVDNHPLPQEIEDLFGTVIGRPCYVTRNLRRQL